MNGQMLRLLDVEGDGKSMFVHDYHFNYFQVGVESLGQIFLMGTKFVYDTSEFGQVWESLCNGRL